MITCLPTLCHLWKRCAKWLTYHHLYGLPCVNRHSYGLFTLLQIYDVSIYKLQDSIVGLTYQLTGNAGDLGEHACELETCVCHTPTACDLVGLLYTIVMLTT